MARTLGSLLRQGVPLSVAQQIVKNWWYAHQMSYYSPGPRRYKSESKYIPAGPNRNVPLTNR